jgi:membrane associated rhomboid family serine protease
MTFPPRGGGGGGGGWRHPDPSRVVWGLIAANGAVWMLWRVDPMTAQRHFVVSLDSLRDGRLWTAATAAFSQESFTHLASNMISLFFFGRGVGQLFGGRPLLLLYLAGGVAGSLAHVGWTHHKERRAGLAGRPAWMRGPARGALGARAAVNAVVLTDVLLFPTRTVLLYGLIPMPAALLGALWLWHDLGGALGGGDGPVAHAGHLGGAATGLAFWLAFKRGLVRPQRWW